MVLISVNVFDVCCKKTLLTWTVIETHDDTLTVSTFYETVSEERLFSQGFIYNNPNSGSSIQLKCEWMSDEVHSGEFNSEPKECFMFSDYNIPEASQHRKRSPSSLSREDLLALSQKLFSILHHQFWMRVNWIELKSPVKVLAQSLSKYAEYLANKRVRMQEIHTSSDTTRQLGENLTVCFTKARSSHPPYLQPVIDTVTAAGLQNPVELGRFFLWIEGGDMTENLKKDIPQYHSRAMRRAAFEKFGLVMKTTKSALRYLYKGDSSASANLEESEIDARVDTFFELEEPSLIYDLREHYKGNQSKFDVFWQRAKEYLEEDVGTAVDDRRHSTIVHMAKAISVRDLREKVKERCPPGTLVPSDEWIRLQFAPSCVSSHTALRYTGKLQVCHKVQQRQWRKQHEDSHYAACIYRYQREYAVQMQQQCVFVCIDDKHRVKIGEPNCPVASAERGRQVIVVVLINDIPEEISGSWYDGQLDLDYLCAARTAPYHSYRNPMERIMSIVNLGLQAVALAREKMPEEMEKAAFKWKNFQVFSAASAAEIDSLWSSLLAIDHEMRLRHDDKITAKDLSPALADFMSHCCKQRHYFFDILKCGKPECMLCKPLQLSASEFSKLSHLPDSTPGTDGHYKPFQEVFKKPTTEEHRPSAKKASSKATLPFRASIQHVHNAGMMLQCDECALWRLVYAKRKLNSAEKKDLESAIDSMSYSCGALLKDAEIPSSLKDIVFMRQLQCHSLIEKLYYSAKCSDICIYCAIAVPRWNYDKEQFYPQCADCSAKPAFENEHFKKTYRDIGGQRNTRYSVIA
eukprot:Em0005g596a